MITVVMIIIVIMFSRNPRGRPKGRSTGEGRMMMMVVMMMMMMMMMMMKEPHRQVTPHHLQRACQVTELVGQPILTCSLGGIPQPRKPSRESFVAAGKRRRSVHRVESHRIRIIRIRNIMYRI
jgi:hypothetical protein